jgi:hypothetical protein
MELSCTGGVQVAISQLPNANLLTRQHAACGVSNRAFLDLLLRACVLRC